MTHRTLRRLVGVACVVSVAACSGSSGPAAPSVTTSIRDAGTDDPAAASTTADSGDTDEARPTTTAPPTTAPPATAPPTTVPPPVVVPAGVRWTPGTVVVDAGPTGGSEGVIELDGELWILASRYNGAAVFRSSDTGATWSPVDVAGPPGDGALRLLDVVRGENGRLLIPATRSRRCGLGDELDDGYRVISFCKRDRPTVFLSDDDGASWREVEPGAMAPPGDASVRLAGVVVTAAGFVAAGTVRGPDWHVRLWSSADGESWTLDREIRGDSGYASAEQLLTDGDTMVLLISEHPCATPNDNTPGWILGTAWVSWLRVYQGAGIDELTLGEHPFHRDLDISDCEFTGSIQGIQEITAATPGASGMVVGGVITLLEHPRPTAEDVAAEEAEDDEAARTSGLRRLSQLVDGAWTLVEIDGVQSADVGKKSQLVDVDGVPGIFESRYDSDGLLMFVPILPDGDGAWAQREPETPVVARVARSAVWVDGTLVVAGLTLRDPFHSTIGPDNPEVLVSFSSSEAVGEPPRCELGPDVVCRFADLTLAEGYPDFAGRDLSGADLAFSDFGDADLTGADLTGATLWGVRSGTGGTMRAANLSGAALQGARIASAVDADLTSANLRSAWIDDASGARFTGATLDRAWFGITDLSVLDGVVLTGARLDVLVPAAGPYEISLAGLDLTEVTISGVHDGPLLKVLDLTGAVLDGSDFRRVDLTAIDPTIDLSAVDVWDDSICPDGLPPDDPPIGTCVRAAPVG